MTKDDVRCMGLIVNIKKKFKNCIYDEYDGWKLMNDSICYIASMKKPYMIEELKTMLDGYGNLEYKAIEIPYFTAVYIEYLNHYKMLILSVKTEYNTLEPSVLNYGIDSKISDSLKEKVTDLNIDVLIQADFFLTMLIITAFDLNIINCNGVSKEDFHYIRLANTQKEFVRLYKKVRNDPMHSDENLKCEYEHLKNFSEIYYSEIKVISDICGNDDGLSIHDAGTSNSQLLMMLATLPKEELLGIDIGSCLATDLELNHYEVVLRYLREYRSARPVEFMQMDFTDESKELPEADITVINDVLEHFENDTVSFNVMERFWKRTGRLLLVHVPQEEIPNASWGHHVSFSKEKLVDWAARLNGAEIISDKYQYNEYITLLDKGFLFLKKN